MTILDKELQIASDAIIRGFLSNIYEEQLNDLITYHLSEDAKICLFRNMGEYSRFLVKTNCEEMKLMLSQTEEIFLKAKNKFKHSKRKNVIVFTDLVSSTEKMNNFGDENYYQNVILAHNEILQRNITKNYGRIIKNIGDAYLAIFSDTFLCMKACVDSQNEFKMINKKRDDEVKILVRMAIHYGDVALKEVEHNNIDVYGAAVNYSARITTHSDAFEIICSKDFVDDFNTGKKYWTKHKNADDPKKIEETKARSDESEVFIKRDIEYMHDCKKNYELSKKIRFVSMGKVALKGFPGTHELYKTSY